MFLLVTVLNNQQLFTVIIRSGMHFASCSSTLTLNTLTTSFSSLSLPQKKRTQLSTKQGEISRSLENSLSKIVTHRGMSFRAFSRSPLASFRRRNFSRRGLRGGRYGGHWRTREEGKKERKKETKRPNEWYELYIPHKHSCRKRRHFDWRKRLIIYARTCLNCCKQTRSTVPRTKVRGFNELVDLTRRGVLRALAPLLPSIFLLIFIRSFNFGEEWVLRACVYICVNVINKFWMFLAIL